MSWIDTLSRLGRGTSRRAPSAMAGAAQDFNGWNDPALLEFIRSGGRSTSGVAVTANEAMFNMTVLRCLSLISFSIGMLPLQLRVSATKEKATDHPLYKVLHRRPNNWMTAFEFRSFLQQQVMIDGDAFAYKVTSGNRLLQLVPIVYSSKKVTLNSDFTVSYEFTMPTGAVRRFARDELLHVRYGLSKDGLTGLSIIKQAAEAIGIAVQGELAAGKMFKNGMVVGGQLSTDNKLSPEAFERLKAQMAEREGAENAGKSMVLEEGLKFTPGGANAKDSQSVEQRKFQIEEIARPFGVPRPLLGLDDTSWGSGIGVLGQFFVRYALNPWFEAWQQAITRDLLSEADAEIYEPNFNAGGLLRGSLTEQADFFAKGLGAGGSTPWLHPDEPRDWLDLPRRDDLPPSPGQQQTGGSE